MSVKRGRHSPEFKFRVALEAAKEQKTISQLSSEFGLHPTQISDWKKQLLEKGKTVFQSNGKHKLQIVQESELYEQIGRLKIGTGVLCFGYRVVRSLKKTCPLQLMTNVVLLSQIILS